MTWEPPTALNIQFFHQWNSFDTSSQAMDPYYSQLFPSSPSATTRVQLLNFVSQAGLESDVQEGQEESQEHYQVENLTHPDSVSGTQLGQEVSIQQQSVSTALENLEQGLNDLCDAREIIPRCVILEKLQHNLVAVKLEAHQKQAKIDRLEGEKASVVELKERVEISMREKGHSLNVRMMEMTKKLQCENGAVIDNLIQKFSAKEHELLALQNRLAEKEKEHYQSTVKIDYLQDELEHLSRAMESLKAKHHLLGLRSNETKLAPDKRSLYSNSVFNPEKGRPLSLDQRITKARATRKHPRMHEHDKNYEHELAVEIEIARIRSCSLQVDRMLEMQYGEVQKLLLRWKATGSDQIMRIWTF